MTSRINAETLRGWLTEKRPVTVLDIRNDEDRAQWFIPGSFHVNAYEALKSGTRSELSDILLPSGVPVVTVCNVGRMSERAAMELQGRGISAVSLAGGMNAWSAAWNTAALEAPDVTITQVRRTGKGCLSYFLASAGEGIIIDAALPPEVYLQLAKESKVRIRYVLDTHIHADHLSRSRILSEMSGAVLILPKQERVHFPHRALEPGESIMFGDSVLESIPTPGHTMESTCYLLRGAALFTGDTLFLEGVGRPDLHAASEEEARKRATLLFQSLRRILASGPDVFVLPGHVSHPVAFDGEVLTARISDVAARVEPWMSSEEAFSTRILSRLPGAPPNYLRITSLNELGELPEGDLHELEAGANRCAVS